MENTGKNLGHASDIVRTMNSSEISPETDVGSDSTLPVGTPWSAQASLKRRQERQMHHARLERSISPAKAVQLTACQYVQMQIDIGRRSMGLEEKKRS